MQLRTLWVKFLNDRYVKLVYGLSCQNSWAETKVHFRAHKFTPHALIKTTHTMEKRVRLNCVWPYLADGLLNWASTVFEPSWSNTNEAWFWFKHIPSTLWNHRSNPNPSKLNSSALPKHNSSSEFLPNTVQTYGIWGQISVPNTSKHIQTVFKPPY